jgi:hypothetical protein
MAEPGVTMTDRFDVNRLSSRAWAGRLAVSAVVAVVYLATQAGWLLVRGAQPLGQLRDYFSYDQYGYLAIVKNVADGQLGLFEPDTMTGSNYYPHAYYLLLGITARIFGLSPLSAWNILGIAIQVALVVVLALVIIRLGGRWWLGLMAPIPFVLGTFAWLFDPQAWYLTLKSHAVLWGAFGVLYTLNGESFALCVAGIGALALIAVWMRPTSNRVRVTTGAIACLAFGLLAAVQTYSFIAIVYCAFFTTAVWVLHHYHAWKLAILSAAILLLVVITGPFVASLAGQLPTLVFGLSSTVPGIVLLIVRTRGTAAVWLGAVVLGALPQVMLTLTGILSGDPFLTYRVASNVNLGLEPSKGWIASLVLALPLAILAVFGLIRADSRFVGYALGFGTAWILLSTNDIWGVNAEPYRLWIDGFTLTAITVLPMLVALVRSAVSHRTDQRGDHIAVALALCLAASALVASASMVDWFRFATADDYHRTIPFNDPRDLAIASVASGVSAAVPGPLVLVDNCIDPKTLKVNSGVPIVFYHLGMAWPEHKHDIDEVLKARANGDLDVSKAIAANVRWVITDSECADDWGERYTSNLEEVKAKSYPLESGSAGTITAWRLRG